MFPEMRIAIGLPSTRPQDELPLSHNEMRAAIQQGQRDSALIRHCLMSAQVQGLSGEDTYVQLAYHALRMLEDTHQRLARFIELSPMPPIAMKESDLPSGVKIP